MNNKVRTLALSVLLLASVVVVFLSLDMALTSSHQIASRNLRESIEIRKHFGNVEHVILIGRKWRGGEGRSACTDLRYIVIGSEQIGVAGVRLKVKDVEPWKLVYISRDGIDRDTRSCWQ